MEEYMRSILRFYAEALEEAGVPYAQEVRQLMRTPQMLGAPAAPAPQPNCVVNFGGVRHYFLGNDDPNNFVGVRSQVIGLIAARDWKGLQEYNRPGATVKSNEGVLYYENEDGVLRALPPIASYVLGI